MNYGNTEGPAPSKPNPPLPARPDGFVHQNAAVVSPAANQPADLPQESRITQVSRDRVPLALYRFPHPDPSAPLLVWGHANGFAAHAYLPLFRELRKRVTIWAWDARGHGNSPLAPERWDDALSADHFADDVAAVLDRVSADRDGRSLIISGHSLGAVAILRHLTRRRMPENTCCVLVEAPVCPPADHAQWSEIREMIATRTAHTRKRRIHWSSPDAMVARIRGRRPFDRWPGEAVSTYCEAILQPDGEGAFRLRCHPDVESRIYRNLAEPSTYSALGSIRDQIDLIGADPSAGGIHWVALMQPEVARLAPRTRLQVVPGATHLFPLEDPRSCASRILQTAAGSPPT